MLSSMLIDFIKETFYKLSSYEFWKFWNMKVLIFICYMTSLWLNLDYITIKFTLSYFIILGPPNKTILCNIFLHFYMLFTCSSGKYDYNIGEWKMPTFWVSFYKFNVYIVYLPLSYTFLFYKPILKFQK